MWPGFLFELVPLEGWSSFNISIQPTLPTLWFLDSIALPLSTQLSKNVLVSASGVRKIHLFRPVLESFLKKNNNNSSTRNYRDSEVSKSCYFFVLVRTTQLLYEHSFFFIINFFLLLFNGFCCFKLNRRYLMPQA